MALSDIDRRLLQRCITGESRSWEEFVDRFVGLVLHVVDHTAQARGAALRPEDREDLVADVFVAIVRDGFRVLRLFRGDSSLATYLTVIARRVVVAQLAHQPTLAALDSYQSTSPHDLATDRAAVREARIEQRISDQDEVERLLAHLDGREAEVVRMYHLEGRTYREISAKVGMPENTIGPTLSRARSKLREARLT